MCSVNVQTYYSNKLCHCDIVKQEWALPEEMGARQKNFKQNPANQNSNRA